MKNNPVNYLFYQPKNAEIRFGLAVEHSSYTPKRYELPGIQFGDRPFAADIELNSFMIATDMLKASRFTLPFYSYIIFQNS